MNDDIRKALEGAAEHAKAFQTSAGVSSARSLHDYHESSSKALAKFQDAMAEAVEAKTAAGLVKRLVREIREFEAKLDQQHEVGMRLVSFGQAVVIYVAEVGCVQPNLVIFVGMNERREPVKLIQHMNQLSFLLTVLPRLDPDAERRPIGFLVGE
jgi:hypothetical protein